VEKEFSDINIRIIHDRIIEGGCSLRRPDILIDLLTHSIIIECDENQHINYECENKRMMEIFQDLGSRPMVFIRFNPDKYIDSNRCIIETCFKPLIKEEDANKKRFYDINKNEWNNRIKVLVNTIRTHLQTIPSKEITEIKLFYDGV
jgi:hypothetical protein